MFKALQPARSRAEVKPTGPVPTAPMRSSQSEVSFEERDQQSPIFPPGLKVPALRWRHAGSPLSKLLACVYMGQSTNWSFSSATSEDLSKTILSTGLTQASDLMVLPLSPRSPPSPVRAPHRPNQGSFPPCFPLLSPFHLLVSSATYKVDKTAEPQVYTRLLWSHSKVYICQGQAQTSALEQLTFYQLICADFTCPWSFLLWPQKCHLYTRLLRQGLYINTRTLMFLFQK